MTWPRHRVNLGCGKDIREGWINIDSRQWPGVDHVVDLEHEDIPLNDGSAWLVLASHVLEHIRNIDHVLDEIHRILMDIGFFIVIVPYGFTTDLYHVRYFTETTLDPVLENRPSGDSLEHRALFTLMDMDVMRRWKPFRWHLKRYLNIELNEYNRIGQKHEIYFLLGKWHGGIK